MVCPSVLCRENAIKLSYLPHLASGKTELVQTVLPHVVSDSAKSTEVSLSFVEKPAFPFSFRVIVPLSGSGLETAGVTIFIVRLWNLF